MADRQTQRKYINRCDNNSLKKTTQRKEQNAEEAMRKHFHGGEDWAGEGA